MLNQYPTFWSEVMGMKDEVKMEISTTAVLSCSVGQAAVN